jgi:hypothetical protein
MIYIIEDILISYNFAIKKMRKAILISLLGFIVFIIPVFGQDPDSVARPEHVKRCCNHYLGINLGSTTGIGFAYRYWPAKGGIQIALLPLYDKDNTYVSFGISYLRELKEYKLTRFMFYAGNHMTNYFVDDFTDNMGFGIGLDYRGYDFIVNFMLGYAGYDIFDNFRTRPAAEFGIFYNF